MSLYKCENKEVTEKGIRKWLILKDATHGCFGVARAEMGALKRKGGASNGSV
jgi:hypothetical protein